MKRIISLTKVLYKSNKNDSLNTGKKSKTYLYLLLGAYILFVFVNFWNLFIDPLKNVGRPELSISLILNIASIFVFMTSITYVANILYFTNDIENISPFPFKPKEIFTAKLITVYLYQLLVVFMFLLPGFVAYGISMGQGVLFYLYSALVTLILPIIPILVVTVFYTILVQFFKFTKHKDFLKVFSTIILLAIVVVFQINLNNNMTENGQYSEEYILEMSENLSSQAPYFVKVAADSLNLQNILPSTISLIWLVIINVVALCVVVYLFDKLYLKGVFYNLEGISPKKAVSKALGQKARSQIISLIDKDIKNLFRNVTFFIQCVLPIFLVPVIILAMSTGAVNELTIEMLSEASMTKLFLGVIVVEFFMLMNQISATAISRDGKDEVSYMKTLPISPEKYIKAKAMPSVIFGVLNLIIALIFLYKTFELSLFELAILFISGILLNFIQSYLFIIIDLKKPKLYWESEVAVVKQNMNVLASIFVWMAVIIITSILGGVLISLDVLYFVVLYLTLLLTIFMILKSYIKKNAVKLYEKVF